MERLITRDLIDWKKQGAKRPLVLQGARMVGKTWILKEFGARNYDNVAYFDLKEMPQVCRIFQENKSVEIIVKALMLAGGVKIFPEKTLIIFDNADQCPEAVKAFTLGARNYHVAAAVTGFKEISGAEHLKMYPMNFSEFLMAGGNGDVVDYLQYIEFIEPIAEEFFYPLYETLRTYFETGGMPEIVKMAVEGRPAVMREAAMTPIIEANEQAETMEYVVEKFDGMDGGFGEKLDADGEVRRYLLDVGLGNSVLQIAASAPTEENRIFVGSKGLLAKNYVLETLMMQLGNVPKFWREGDFGPEADFVIERDGQVIPVAVKYARNVKTDSLEAFKGAFPETKLKVIFSLENLWIQGDVLNIPLFMADQADMLMAMALE